MLRDLFLPSGDGATDPLGRAADHEAGVAAVSVGIAANASLERGAPVVHRRAARRSKGAVADAPRSCR